MLVRIGRGRMSTIGDERPKADRNSAASNRGATPPEEASIEVSFEEIGEDEIVLDEGGAATPAELERARHTVAFLEGLLPRLTDPTDAAQVASEIGALQGWPLGDVEGSLDAMRDAYRRQPTSLPLARNYRKAAMRANAHKELADALESEAKLASVNGARLSCERARILEARLDKPEAARFNYQQAIQDQPHADALQAVERLALIAGDASDASTCAQRLASLVTDVTIRAEHLARAARHLGRDGDVQGALALAVQAQVHAASSPAISFTIERLLVADGALAELAGLRQRQLEEGIIDAADAWFDAGVIALYRLDDPERAARAFAEAASAATNDDHRLMRALEQQSLSLGRAERWPELIEVERRLLGLLDDEGAAERWVRIAQIQDRRLQDHEAAAKAYQEALARNPSSPHALEGAGRLLQRTRNTTDRRERLLEMHRLEARAASSPGARAGALRRVGEMLIEDEATLDEGIEKLREALLLLPRNLSVLTALERGLYRKKAWKMLVDLYEHQLESEENASRRAWLLAQMGLIAADRLGDDKRAITALKQHLEMNETHASIPWTRLARLLDESDDHDAHVEVLTRIAAQTDGAVERATLMQRIAAVHERRGAHEEAMIAYEEAIEIAPPNHPVYAEAGRAFLRAERYEDLLRVLLAGSREGDDRDRARWLVKAAQVMARHLDLVEDAIDTLHTAHATHPECGANEALRTLLLEEGRWQDLFDLLDEEDDAPGRLLERAFYAEASGENDAVELYARALDGGERLAWLPYARLAARQERWEELEQRYAALDGNDATIHHARYRAGEIAAEHLRANDRAVQHWRASHRADRTSTAPLVALVLIRDHSDEQVELVESLQASTSDESTRLACMRRRIELLDALGRDDEALATRLDLLAMEPSEPWVLTEVELALEERGDRVTLAEVLRRAVDDPQLDPAMQPMLERALGAVLEQLGRVREAVVAYEASQREGAAQSRATLLGLRRCYDAMEDDRVGQVLAALASCPPSGPEQGLAYRALGWWWMERGDAEAATKSFENALGVYPCDYDALNDLIEVAGESASLRVTDAMLRAFEHEGNDETKRRLGLALATRLLRAGRIEPARETVDRLLDEHPDDLRALMLHAEVQEQRGRWQRAVATLDRIASREDAPAPVRVEALLRLVSLQTHQLDDPDAAKAATKRLLELDASGALSTETRLDVEEALGDYRAAAQSLEELAKSEDLSEAERGILLLRLAVLHEEHLDDPAAALAALGRVTDAEGREQVAKRLIALGEKTSHWDLATKALRATLDGDEELDPRWEAALRRRLGDLLHRSLGQPEEAFGHYERVIELAPDDTVTLQALADIAAGQSAAKAIAFHRRLLSVEPRRVSSYRALRQLFLKLGDNDGAFCAEAMLVGLNAADEEERYFYRQRRMNVTQKLVAKLNSDELTLLFPQRNEPAFELFAALQSVLCRVFGVDRGAYGIDDDETEVSRILRPVAKSVAYLLGVDQVELRLLERMHATSELGEPPLVLLPRSLEDALRREQQFVCGAVVGRIAFSGIAADPNRVTALDADQVEHTLAAACALAGTPIDSDRGAIVEDIEKRLDAALEGDKREHVLAIAKRYASSTPTSGQAILDAHRDAALRCAILCAQDPSVAVRCLRSFGHLFQAEAKEGVIADDLVHVLPFGISPEHLRLRSRLAGDVKGASS